MHLADESKQISWMKTWLAKLWIRLDKLFQQKIITLIGSLCVCIAEKKETTLSNECALLKKYKFIKNLKSKEPMCSANCVRQMIRWRVCENAISSNRKSEQHEIGLKYICCSWVFCFFPVVVKYLNDYEFVDIGKSAANGINNAMCVLRFVHKIISILGWKWNIYTCVCVLSVRDMNDTCSIEKQILGMESDSQINRTSSMPLSNSLDLHRTHFC